VGQKQRYPHFSPKDNCENQYFDHCQIDSSRRDCFCAAISSIFPQLII
jgi:hypothetical protein